MLSMIVPGGQGVSRADLTQFEKRYGLQLPTGYVAMLEATNGGRPEKARFPILGLLDNPFGSVNFFFGLKPDYAVYDLIEILDRIAGVVPHGVVPIADNGGVDHILLDLRFESEKVVFWDRAHFWSTGEWREGDLYLIAETFQEFLNRLEPNVVL